MAQQTHIQEDKYVGSNAIVVIIVIIIETEIRKSGDDGDAALQLSVVMLCRRCSVDDKNVESKE